MQNQELKKTYDSVDWGRLEITDYIPNLYYFAKDVNGHFIRANHAFVKLMKLKSDSGFFGTKDEDYFPRFLCDKYREDDRTVMSTGKVLKNQMELIVNTKGTMDWFTTTKSPLYSRHNEVVGVECISRYIKKANFSVKSNFEYEKSILYIIEHYAKQISIGELAKLECVSLRQFERNFKFNYSISPKKYIERIRLDAACQLLVNSKLTIYQIADKVGFFDSSHFTHSFYKIHNISPSGFRKKYIA